MANRVNKVINGTAADEPSDHRTQFKRKKIPSINLELKKKVITFDKGDGYSNNIENDNYTNSHEDHKDNDTDDDKDHRNYNDDDDDNNDDNDNNPFFLDAYLLWHKISHNMALDLL